jgi:hypothetical protein
MFLERPGAGEVVEDRGHSFVRIEHIDQRTLPESGFDTAALAPNLGDIPEKDPLQNPDFRSQSTPLPEPPSGPPPNAKLVSEAALNDGPGGNDDGSNLDPAQSAGVGTTASGRLLAMNGEISSVSFVSGPGGGATNSGTTAEFALTAMDNSWFLTVNKTTGDYRFTLLKNVSHPLESQAYGEDSLPLVFSVTAAGPDGLATEALNVEIRDDQPVATDTLATVGADTRVDSNIVIVLDRSGSMREDPGVSDFSSRIDLARAAAGEMLVAYQELGRVNLLVVDFASSANSSGWFSGDNATQDANDYLAELNPGGSTSYTAALDAVQDAFPIETPAADQSFVYFLSDGRPNQPLTPDEINAWEDFLIDREVTTAFAVGIGGGISDGGADLEHVAFPNNEPNNLIMVTDESQLIDTLVETVAGSATGNIIADLQSGFTFGADGPGFILSLQVDELTYTFSPEGVGEISPSDGSASMVGTALAVPTTLGGNLQFDFSSGDYGYTLPPPGDRRPARGVPLHHR